MRFFRFFFDVDIKHNLVPFLDPNEKIVAANKFIQNEQLLLYAIHFENIGNTSAKDIFVNDTLDNKLNLSTVRVVAKNGSIISLLPDTQALLFQQQKNITIPVGNFSINITVHERWTANFISNVLYWNLSNIYLPVNRTDELLFSIKPKQNLSSGTEIRNNATIQFEIFESVITNETLNIIDEIRPSCTMDLLPNVTNRLNFTISWNGTDPIGEIDFYTIFASIDRGGFNPLINRTNYMNATFTGEQGRTYKFICIATDTAGNTEVQAPIAEAETVIPGPRLAVEGQPRIGTTINLAVSDPLHGGNKYVLAMSLGTYPGIPLPNNRTIPLNPDMLFLLSLQAPSLLGLSNNINFLDPQGRGSSTWAIPNIPEIVNLTVYFAFVTIDHTMPIPFVSISPAVPITLRP